MGKSGKKDSQRGKKDQSRVKSGSAPIVKAKDKRKKTNAKKLIDKLGKDITTINNEFTELQPKLVLEKEDAKKLKHGRNKETKPSEVQVNSTEPTISQEKRLEATTEVFANL